MAVDLEIDLNCPPATSTSTDSQAPQTGAMATSTRNGTTANKQEDFSQATGPERIKIRLMGKAAPSTVWDKQGEAAEVRFPRHCLDRTHHCPCLRSASYRTAMMTDCASSVGCPSGTIQVSQQGNAPQHTDQQLGNRHECSYGQEAAAESGAECESQRGRAIPRGFSSASRSPAEAPQSWQGGHGEH
eukprot:scaffold2221_cov368-Prasinococcus_capsulatus_cf.AAC.2